MQSAGAYKQKKSISNNGFSGRNYRKNWGNIFIATFFLSTKLHHSGVFPQMVSKYKQDLGL